MKILTLTCWPGDTPIRINMDRVTVIIEGLDESGCVECTHVYFDNDNRWSVKETPQAIGKMANVFAY